MNNLLQIEDNGTNVARRMEDGATAEKRKDKKQRKKREKQEASDQPLTANRVITTGDEWYTGKCARWLHRFGFISVAISDTSEQQPRSVSVFIHVSILPPECGGSLTPGADVSVQLGSSQRGPCITALKLASAT